MSIALITSSQRIKFTKGHGDLISLPVKFIIILLNHIHMESYNMNDFEMFDVNVTYGISFFIIFDSFLFCVCVCYYFSWRWLFFVVNAFC